MTQVSESIAVAAAEKGSDAPKPKDFKVAEVREDGLVIVEMPDGRMFPVAVADGVEVKKRNAVKLKFTEVDKDGVPVDATLTGLAS